MVNSKLFELFAKGVEGYAESADSRIRKNPVCAFFPLTGQKYSKDLMIVGRATNGWLKEDHTKKGTSVLSADALSTKTKRSAFLNVIRKDAQAKDPMDWVLKRQDDSGYNTRRSAFWRVAKETILHLKAGQNIENNWPSFLAWSNLYKIAPWKGGNPGTLMRRAQQEWAVQMLSLELKTLAPRNILFMTGYSDSDWAANSFLPQLGFKLTKEPHRSHVKAVGQLSVGSGSTSNVVVVSHPQGKAEGKIVQQAARYFS